MLTKEELDAMFEASKLDHTNFVGSEIRQLIGMIRELQKPKPKIVLIFKSRPTPDENEQVFVEAHDENGKSINVGEWAADGEYESLTIDYDKLASN